MRSAARPIATKVRTVPEPQLSLIGLPSQTEMTQSFNFGRAVVDPSRCVFAGSFSAGDPFSDDLSGPQVVFVSHATEESLGTNLRDGSTPLTVNQQLRSQIISGTKTAFLVRNPVAAAVALALLGQVLQGKITVEKCNEQLAPHIIRSA
jgi:hypothetical protein